MKCAYCGNEINESHEFCPYCGKFLKRSDLSNNRNKDDLSGKEVTVAEHYDEAEYTLEEMRRVNSPVRGQKAKQIPDDKKTYPDASVVHHNQMAQRTDAGNQKLNIQYSDLDEKRIQMDSSTIHRPRSATGTPSAGNSAGEWNTVINQTDLPKNKTHQKIEKQTDQKEGFLDRTARKIKHFFKMLLLAIILIIVVCVAGVWALVHFDIVDPGSIPIVKVFVSPGDEDVEAKPGDETVKDPPEETPQEVTEAIKEANAAASNGDWNGALTGLEETQKVYPDNETLKKAYEDIKKRMPATLETLPIISSDSVVQKDGILKDRYGKSYNGGTEFQPQYYDNGKAYALLNLDGLYTKFTSTMFLSPDAENGQNITVMIYVDEELVFQQDSITEETAPMPISVDVKNGNTMRIVVGTSSGKYRPYVDFTDSNFEKAE